MTGIDFFTYVVSSTRTSFNFLIILIASAILIASIVLVISVIASHVHIGISPAVNHAGVTVGLTSAGTVAIAASVRGWVTRRSRRSYDKEGGLMLCLE
jgi:hypothetical protein